MNLIRYDIIKIRPINYNGIVTSHNMTVYFYNYADVKNKTYIVSIDNPEIGRFFKIRFSDILTITNHLTNQIIYTKSPDDAL